MTSEPTYVYAVVVKPSLDRPELRHIGLMNLPRLYADAHDAVRSALLTYPTTMRHGLDETDLERGVIHLHQADKADIEVVRLEVQGEPDSSPDEGDEIGTD